MRSARPTPPARPVTLTKLVFVMPSAWACWFIIVAYAASLPATASAIATEASLPDWMIMPLRSSSTLTGLRGSMNMREPRVFQADCETLMS